MKKFFSFLLVKIIPLTFVSFLLSCCVAAGGAVLVMGGAAVIGAGGLLSIPGEMISSAVEGAKKEAQRKKDEAAADAEMERKISLNELIYGLNRKDYSNIPEENRLTRRDSALVGGTPVDVTPYMLHERSFAVTDNGIKQAFPVLEIERKPSVPGLMTNAIYAFEFDFAATFELEKQPYKMLITAAVNAKSQSEAKNFVNKYVWNYIADKLDVDVAGITKQKTQIVNTRKGSVGYKYRLANRTLNFLPLFYQNVQPCYYQFDIEAEYEKPANYFGFGGGIKSLNKVYRSNLWTLPAAALDVQAAVWKDVNAAGHRDIMKQPLPIINFVKALRYTQ